VPHAVFAEGTIVKLRLALCIAAFFAMWAPALAQDDLASPNAPPPSPAMSGLAPADEYFGHYNLSVLGIANNIRDAGSRIDLGGDIHVMLTGPLSFATDAIKSWEDQYPSDPWIARDLLALEAVYLKVPSDECFRLASKTEAWLMADYPNTIYAAQARKQLADATPAQPVYQPVVVRRTQPAIPSYAIPWERYAALRAPLGY
jgi:hypothetical protein